MGRDMLLEDAYATRLGHKFALRVKPFPPYRPAFDPDPKLPEDVFPKMSDLQAFEVAMEFLVESSESQQTVASVQTFSWRLMEAIETFKKQFVRIVRTKDNPLRKHFRYRQLVLMWADLLKQIWVQLALYIDTRLKHPNLWWRQAFPEETSRGLEITTDTMQWIQSALLCLKLWH